jgi:nucleotide-binding universal stress UspA family protein
VQIAWSPMCLPLTEHSLAPAQSVQGHVARPNGPVVTGHAGPRQRASRAMADLFLAREARPETAHATVSLPGKLSSDALEIRRLLLATDLSPASETATAEAIALAQRRDADLVVLSVVDPRRLRLPGGPFVRRADQERSELLSGVQAIVVRARSAGVRATFLVWEGDPAETILAAAGSEAADIIVMGSHGRGRIGRLLLGSTSARVSDEASCRVIVVPS